MPISLKKLCGRKLAAPDGHIGHVDDFYFEDHRWAVRYVVADTGCWMPGRRVLLSPYAFGHLEPCGDCLPINLTRKQIEHSPGIQLHKPVSRQYEERYHAYYQWPPYWKGGGLWGAGSSPADPPPADPNARTAPGAAQPEDDDSHLRSARAVTGYEVQASDGVIGLVTDFLVDEINWQIRDVIVSPGSLFSVKPFTIAPEHVARISCAQAKVFVTISKEAIRKNPDCLPTTTTHENASRQATSGS